MPSPSTGGSGPQEPIPPGLIINLDFGSNIIDDERDKSDPTDDQVETPSQQVVHWAEGAYETTGDDRLRELTNAVVLGKADRYADGTTVKQNGGG